MRRRERIDDLARVAQRFLQRQAAVCDQRVQRPAAHQLHRQVLDALGRSDVEDGDDVRVLQRRGELRFLKEAGGRRSALATRSAESTLSAT